MKKKSILARLGVMALVCMLATTSLMSGTLAKYTEVKSAVGSAMVAKWNPSVSVNGAAVTTADGTFDLRDTMDKPTAVASGVASGVICPGMEGTIPITLSAGQSDVPVEYVIRMFYTNKDESVNQKSTFEGLTFTPTGQSSTKLSDLPFTEKNSVDTMANYLEIDKGTVSKGTNVSKDIKWGWLYERGTSENAEDTAFGQKADGFEFHIQIVLTQANPAATKA